MAFFKKNSGLATVIATIALAFSLLANLSPVQKAIAQFNSPQTFVGTAGGTTSAATVNIHNVTQLTDVLYVPIRFYPSGANAGAVTLTLDLDSGSPLGPEPILKQTQTSGGLSALTGNEFQANQIVEVMWDGTEFQCLTCFTTVAAGTVADFSGPIIPAGWLLANGSAQSRTAQSVLFNAVAYTAVAATTINGNATFTVANASLYQVGWFVGGSNVPCNSQITSINTGTNQITINNTATNGGATTLSIGPYGQGDCATTFNLPSYVGRATAGVDGSTNITNATCANPATLGSGCGNQQYTVQRSDLPNVLITPPSSVNNIAQGSNTTLNQPGTGSPSAFPSLSYGAISTSFNLNGNTTQTLINKLMPIGLTYKIVKT